jgi:hypothetical protein
VSMKLAGENIMSKKNSAESTGVEHAKNGG